MNAFSDENGGIGHTESINRSARSISLCIDGITGQEQTARYRVYLYSRDMKSCRMVKEGPAGHALNGDLHRILSAVEDREGVAITAIRYIGLPQRAGMETRIRMRYACLNAGIGTPDRMYRTAAFQMYGYWHFKQSHPTERVFLIRAEADWISLIAASLDRNGMLTEMTMETAVGSEGCLPALRRMLNQLMQQYLLDISIVMIGCDAGIAENCMNIIRGGVPDTAVGTMNYRTLEATALPALDRMRAGEIGGVLCEAAGFDYSLRDEKGIGRYLSIEKEDLIPVFHRAIMPVTQVTGSSWTIYEDDRCIGVMNSVDLSGTNAAPDSWAGLYLRISVDGEVSWERTYNEPAPEPVSKQAQSDQERKRELENLIQKQLRQADEYREKGDFYSELDTLADICSKAPDHAELLIKLGRAYVYAGKLDRGMMIYRMAQKRVPKFPNLYANIGAVYNRKGDKKNAVSCYRKAVRLLETNAKGISPQDIGVLYANAVYVGAASDRKEAEAWLLLAEKNGYDTALVRQQMRYEPAASPKKAVPPTPAAYQESDVVTELAVPPEEEGAAPTHVIPKEVLEKMRQSDAQAAQAAKAGQVSEKENLPWEGWRTLNRIGSGGFGSVYEIARSFASGRGFLEHSAMKVINLPKDQNALDADFYDGFSTQSIIEKYLGLRRRFEEEYQWMAMMKSHPNIVRCEEIATIPMDDGIGWRIYIRMELLTPLPRYLQTHSYDEAFVRKLGKDICSALAECERKHIIHRDIKPENIMISEYGTFKLGDFGIARTMEHTMAATYTGTRRYMAPEIPKGTYGKTVDIYSLGLVMYWLMNNRRMPFWPADDRYPTPDEQAFATVRRMAGEPLPPPGHGSPGIRRVILKACAYNPEMRYQSAREMLEDLGRYSSK